MRRGIPMLVLLGLAPVPLCHAASLDHAGLVRGGHEISMTVGAQGYDGVDVQVGRYDGELRGAVRGSSLQATLKPDGVSGVLGGSALDLHVSRSGSDVVARGMYQGQLSELRLGQGAITGHVGRCSYDLIRQGQRFRGTSTCGASPIPTELALPASMDGRTDAERALALCFLLGPGNAAKSGAGASRLPAQSRYLATGSSAAGDPPRMTVAARPARTRTK